VTRSVEIALVALLAVVALAAPSIGATPIKGATYKGPVEGGDAKVTLKVSSTGKRLTFVLSCYGLEAVRIKRVRVRDGKFVAARPSFVAKGRFVTRRKAKGTISGNACFLPQGAGFRAVKV
jgi:hypothetical protein